MSTGQLAMAEALMLVQAGHRRNGRWARGTVPDAPGDSGGTSNSAWQKQMKDAGTIVDHAPDLAADVVSGATALDAAYKQAVEARKLAERISELPAGPRLFHLESCLSCSSLWGVRGLPAGALGQH